MKDILMAVNNRKRLENDRFMYSYLLIDSIFDVF
jgi:hypothetical protein